MAAKPKSQVSAALGPARACPICGKASSPATHPFCSKRCADVDLNRWLSGGYAIPAVETDDEPDGDPPEA